MTDIDPEQAAAAMEQGDEPTETPEIEGEPVEVEIGPQTPSREVSIYDRLLSTEPNPELEDVDNPWQPDVGGPTRIYRGIMKLGDIEGLPAVADLLIGAVETAHKLGGEDDEQDDEQDEQTDSETDPETETETEAGLVE